MEVCNIDLEPDQTLLGDFTVSNVAVSPDSNIIVSVGWEGEVKVWVKGLR